MLLQDAIKLAAKFVDKRKDAPGVMKALRLIPAQGDFPPRLYATDGVVGLLLSVDQDLPNLLLPAAELVKAVQKTASVTRVEAAGFGGAEIHLSEDDGNAVYRFEGFPLADYPGFPALPETYFSLDDEAVRRVSHAAGKEEHKPDYHVLRFRPYIVEAFDGSRMARAELANAWEGLVPVRVFSHWPRKGDAEYVFTQHHAFFRIGDQIRFAPIQTNPQYPKLEELIPKAHDGAWMVVEAAALLAAVQRAGKLSPTAAVQFCFGPDFVLVKAWAEANKVCEVRVEGFPGKILETDCEILLDAKLLEGALRAVATPRLKLCYRGTHQPVRLESGGFVECIWHMRAPQPGV